MYQLTPAVCRQCILLIHFSYRLQILTTCNHSKVDLKVTKKNGKLLKSTPRKVHYDENHFQVKRHFCRFGYCDAGFYHYANLERHTLIHTKEKQGKCSICSREIPCFYDVSTHERRHFKLYSTSMKALTPKDEETMIFSCKSCDTKFSSLSSVRDHIYPNIKCLWCSKCGSGFSTLEKKAQHSEPMKADFDKNNVTCSDCHDVFDTTCDSNCHSRIHRGGAQRKCSQCSITLSNYPALRLHMKRFHSAIILKSNKDCDECKIIFGNQNLLRCHQALVHSADKSGELFHCHVGSCSLQLETVKECTEHIIKQHCSSSTKLEKIICMYCGKTPNRKLRSHIYRHITLEANKTWRDCICKLCNQRCNSIRHLKTHVTNCQKNFENRKQLILPKLQCYFCGSIRFTIQSQLEVHLRRHVNERIHKCTICKKSWVTPSDLKKDIKWHFGTKNYICKYCGKAFTIVENKIRHENAVYSVKNVSCQICGKTFAHHNYLKDHLYIHNEKKKFACKLCGKAYASRPNMYRHIREMHK